MLQRLSLGNLGICVGLVLTTIGFVAYATNHPTLNLAGFFYGMPLLLGGLALKSGELRPIPFTTPSSPELVALRKEAATVTQKKLISDVTRFRYGQDVHLDRALELLELGATDNDRPELTGIRETQIDHAYTLILEFDSPHVSLGDWQERHEKMTRYFGPNVRVDVSQPDEDQIELALITEPADATAEPAVV
jgi:hypothetical protein